MPEKKSKKVKRGDQQKIKITKYDVYIREAKKLSGILWLNLWIAFYGNIASGPGSMGVRPQRPHLGPFPYKKKSRVV